MPEQQETKSYEVVLREAIDELGNQIVEANRSLTIPAMQDGSVNVQSVASGCHQVLEVALQGKIKSVVVSSFVDAALEVLCPDEETRQKMLERWAFHLLQLSQQLKKVAVARAEAEKKSKIARPAEKRIIVPE